MMLLADKGGKYLEGPCSCAPKVATKILEIERS